MAKESIYKTAGLTIKTGGFVARLFGYAVFYVVITIFYITILYLSGIHLPGTKIMFINYILLISTLFVIPAIPFIFWEKKVRKFRRENGLSVYGNIEKELEQMEFNELYAKEMKAKEAYGVASVGDKKDLNYWFDLLQKGAISKEEYEAKKAELI